MCTVYIYNTKRHTCVSTMCIKVQYTNGYIPFQILLSIIMLVNNGCFNETYLNGHQRDERLNKKELI